MFEVFAVAAGVVFPVVVTALFLVDAAYGLDAEIAVAALAVAEAEVELLAYGLLAVDGRGGERLVCG